MPFIPHTDEDVQAMLKTCGIEAIDDLFDEIPPELRTEPLKKMAPGLNEFDMTALMQTHAMQDGLRLSFIGAGAYKHHTPKAVWDIASRGEYLTAYTPYQAEASQGTLQLLWEFQTMMASLMGLPVANASLYEGATALAEAILMTVRMQKGKVTPRVLIPGSLHPHYRSVLKTLIERQGIVLEEIPYIVKQGTLDLTALAATLETGPATALVIAQPNFFGALEPVDQLTDWANENNIPVIGVVNPLAMAWLKPPGQWGQQGAMIACGEAQPLGIPLASGGPYCGFLACAKSYLRQMPGRIVGRTTDAKGRMGYTLTLQAREQHIRRAKATSNICTNQGLLVTVATLYMSLMGPTGLKQVAVRSHQRMSQLSKKMAAKLAKAGIKPLFDSAYFHERAFQLPKPTADVLQALGEQGIDGGFDLTAYYPELDNGLLICTTETKSEADLDRLCDALCAICEE